MSDLTSIDDLLGGAGAGDEPAPRGTRQRSLHIRVIIVLGVAALLTLPVFVLLRVFELEVPFYLLFGLALTLVMVWRYARELRPAPRSRQAGARPYDDQVKLQDGVLLAISRWDTLLTWSAADAARFVRKVHPRLTDLVDERLRQRHGVTRQADPRKAKELLGEQLWTFLEAPPKRPPNARELDVIVNALERL
jgi:hypothetical protein